MITQTQYNKIKEMLSRYLDNESTVTLREINDLANTLTPTSPKSGKEVCFGTLCTYIWGDMPSHCNKYQLMYTLERIVQTNAIKPEKKLGFYDA